MALNVYKIYLVTAGVSDAHSVHTHAVHTVSYI